MWPGRRSIVAMMALVVVCWVGAGCTSSPAAVPAASLPGPSPAPAASVPAAAAAAPATTATSVLAPELSAWCPGGDHSAVVDRDRQSAWLCEDGTATYEFAFTGAISQPDAGSYPVYAKDRDASSTNSKGTSTMTHFVAFTYGKFKGARIAFHSVPIDAAGAFLQPLDSVGEPGRRGESAGCLRVVPDDAVRVWDWLDEGDEVRVIN